MLNTEYIRHLFCQLFCTGRHCKSPHSECRAPRLHNTWIHLAFFFLSTKIRRIWSIRIQNLIQWEKMHQLLLRSFAKPKKNWKGEGDSPSPLTPPPGWQLSMQAAWCNWQVLLILGITNFPVWLHLLEEEIQKRGMPSILPWCNYSRPTYSSMHMLNIPSSIASTPIWTEAYKWQNYFHAFSKLLQKSLAGCYAACNFQNKKHCKVILSVYKSLCLTIWYQCSLTVWKPCNLARILPWLRASKDL